MRLIHLKISTGILLLLALASCGIPQTTLKTPVNNLPEQFTDQVLDSNSIGALRWRDYFKDPDLVHLIDEALQHNQEFLMAQQEVQMAQFEAMARKGAYRPSVDIGVGAGLDKTARYTATGATQASAEITPGQEIPEPLSQLNVGVRASWEVDIWKKLRNSQKAAFQKYLASVEARRYMQTRLVAEIAETYYDLLSLDQQADILQRNIYIQRNALEIVRLEKLAARTTELAVKKFEAEVFKNQSRLFEIKQLQTIAENNLNRLVGRMPQPIVRNAGAFVQALPDQWALGIPSGLLSRRPDIRQAENELQATQLDIKSAKAAFYPSFNIGAGAGFQAFQTAYLFQNPASLAYNLTSDLIAPLINRTALKAGLKTANARQIQAAYNYELKLLQAYVEVRNQYASIDNLKQNVAYKLQQVDALTQSIDIAVTLFKSARADYMEVLLTQRDALDARFDLIEAQKQQWMARIWLYQALGGGWN